MKLKGKVNIPDTVPLVVTLLVSAVLIAVRTIQMKNYIDPQTGFATGGEFVNGLLIGLLATCIVVFVAMSFVSKQANLPLMEEGKKKDATFALFAALGFVYNIVSSVVTINPMVSGVLLTDASSDKIRGLASNIGLIFAALSAVYFVLVFVQDRSGKPVASKLPILALAPAVWAALRLFALFVTKISFVRISDLALEIISICFMALFFIAYAQCRSNVYSKGTAWKLNAFGLSAVVVIFMLGGAKIILSFVDHGSFINPMFPLKHEDIAIAVFIISVVFSQRKIEEDTVIEQNTEEAAE